MPINVVELNRYPIKSMRGESLTKAEVSVDGILGDRAFAIRDETTGHIRGAKKIPLLMQLSSELETTPSMAGVGPVRVHFPDGQQLSSQSAAIHEKLSEFLQRPVSLWPLVEKENQQHYLRGPATEADLEQELRQVFARTPSEPLPDLSVFPPEIFQFESPPGTYFDAFPISLISRQSLKVMQMRFPELTFDLRRFRMNLIIDINNDQGRTPPLDFPEQAWCGRQLKVGSTIIEITTECPRCVMVTHEQADLAQETQIMRALVQQNNGILGVYAKVIEAGQVSLGDQVELLN